MLQPLLTKLRHAGTLTTTDEDAVRRTFSQTIEIRRNGTVMHEGEPPTVVTALVEGMAFRYKTMPSGKRQITAIIVPGDICDLSSLFFNHLDYGIEAVTDCEVAKAKRSTVLDLIASHPNIAYALWWSTMADEATIREWVVNVGRRTAHQRVAHLLCEVFLRNRLVALAEAHVCTLPLTQENIADATGLTVVHVNRVLQDFRAARLIDLKQRRLTIYNWERLCEVGEFDPSYLHRKGSVVAAADCLGDARPESLSTL